MTCAVRENAETKIWNRLNYFKSLKTKRSRDLPPLKIGLLGKWLLGILDSIRSTCTLFPGCMAERLKTKLLETDKMIDLVAGPGMCRSAH